MNTALMILAYLHIIWRKMVDQYGNKVAEYLMEKDAAEKLLKNANVWKIPKDEVDMIKSRLQIFINELKTRGL